MSYFTVKVTNNVTLKLRRSKSDPHNLYGRWIVNGQPQKGLDSGYLSDWAKAVQVARNLF